MGMKIGDVGGLVCFEDEREYRLNFLCGKTLEVIVGLIWSGVMAEVQFEETRVLCRRVG